MSVLNRKMFKPRNARNALNRAAGIPSVARFHAGGPVGHTHSSFGPANMGGRQQVGSLSKGVGGSQINVPIFRTPQGQQIVTSRSGRRFMFPTTSPTLSGATDIGMARTALKGGLGSLNPAEQSYMSAAMGKLAGRNVASPVKNYLGDSVVGEIAESASELAGTVGGGVGGLLTGLISDDTGDKTTLAGRVGLMEPSDEYLASLGIKPADPNPANLQTASAMGRPFPAGPPKPDFLPTPGGAFPKISKYGPPEMSGPIDMSDPQVRAQLERERRAREITEAGGDVVVDPNTGEVTSSTGQSIQELLKFAQPDPEEGLPVVDTDDQDPVRPKSAADPAEPGSEDPAAAADRDEADNETAAVVKQARTANAAEGIPPQDSAQSEVTTAIERGTQTAEDIKAEFLKLLPKYEEDPSIAGLNLAMMGFAIAGGESSNALKNVADGMKKTLPNFIKSKQKKDAFNREADLLASKYTIQRLEGDRKLDRQKSTYFVTSPFTGPDGVEYKEGIVRLNDKSFDVLQRAGLTGNLTTQNVLTARINKQAANAKSGLKLTDISKLYDGETREIFGVKYRINVPNASGLAAGRKESFVSENEHDSVTEAYVNSLEKFRALDKGIQDAINIADEGRVSGPEGFFDRVVDSTITATPASVLEKFGIDKSKHTLSSANKFTRQHAVLSMQLAPLILGEAGKTISDADRVRVASALGFSVTDSQPGVEGAGVQIGGPIQGFFTSEAQIKEALGKIQGVLREKTEEKHREYKGYLRSANIDLAPNLPEVQSAFVGEGVAGLTTGLKGLNYRIIDAPEDADYDLEIKFGD